MLYCNLSPSCGRCIIFFFQLVGFFLNFGMGHRMVDGNLALCYPTKIKHNIKTEGHVHGDSTQAGYTSLNYGGLMMGWRFGQRRGGGRRGGEGGSSTVLFDAYSLSGAYKPCEPPMPTPTSIAHLPCIINLCILYFPLSFFKIKKKKQIKKIKIEKSDFSEFKTNQRLCFTSIWLSVLFLSSASILHIFVDAGCNFCCI